jgi:hypothetical protein
VAPYVDQGKRRSLDPEIRDLAESIDGPGDLNYAITRLCLNYLAIEEGVGYIDFNEVIGVLECAKLEMYRRAVATYEDRKIAANGDVYN